MASRACTCCVVAEQMSYPSVCACLLGFMYSLRGCAPHACKLLRCFLALPTASGPTASGWPARPSSAPVLWSSAAQHDQQPRISTTYYIQSSSLVVIRGLTKHRALAIQPSSKAQPKAQLRGDGADCLGCLIIINAATATAIAPKCAANPVLSKLVPARAYTESCCSKSSEVCTESDMQPNPRPLSNSCALLRLP